MTSVRHEVLRLWIRPEAGGPMVEVDTLELEEDGVVGDHARGGPRHLTLIFEDDWNRAGEEVGGPVDPAGRRANVLLSGGNGASWLESQIELGGIQLEIRGIVHPCQIMDDFRDGLREALKPEGRGGVWGRVIQTGRIGRGDQITLLQRNP